MKDGNEHVKTECRKIWCFFSMLCRDDGTLVNAGERVRTENWRKRVGVEPTKDRQAALPGFEVRTPHQGRFPSPQPNHQLGGESQIATRLPPAQQKPQCRSRSLSVRHLTVLHDEVGIESGVSVLVS